MGWDVVEIGMKHNLPVDDPLATAKEVAKRLNRNIKLVAQNDYTYDVTTNTVSTTVGDDFIELGEFKVNDSTNFTRMTVSRYQAKIILQQIGKEKLLTAKFTDEWAKLIIDDIEENFELYELEDDEIYIRIFRENVDLDVSVCERWHMWEFAFHDDHYRNWLNNYRMQIYNRAKQFGCHEVIICSDQGPTQEIYERMNWHSDKLKEYTKSFRYIKDRSCVDDIADREKDARQILFADYFAGDLVFAKNEFVDVVLDDFKDLQ